MADQNCPTTDILTAFLEGRAEDATHVSLENHISQCDRCQAVIESLEIEDDLLVWQLRYLCNAPIPSSDTPLQKVIKKLESPGQKIEHDLPVDSQPDEFEAVALETLGDFKLIREIGRGGMGVVYEADQISLNRRVALKTLPMASLLDERRLRRFQNEAQAVASLQHPHITSIHAVGVERGVHYYAMDFIEGQNLSQIIESLQLARNVKENSDVTDEAQRNAQIPLKTTLDAGDTERSNSKPTQTTRHQAQSITIPLSSFSLSGMPQSPADFEKIVELTRQAASALAYAHENGIVHRDVKPANMMLDTKGNIWLTDFGVAHIETDANLTRTGDVFGTLGYMSPEQANGQHELVDRRTDIYSLGATLYEMLTLQPLISGESKEELLRKITGDIKTSPRKLNPAIPVDLETIVLKATTKELDGRYSTSEEMANDLHCFLDKRPISARLPSLWDRSIKWLHRNRLIAVLACSVFISVFILTIVLSVYNYRLSTLNEEFREIDYVNKMMLASTAAKKQDSRRVSELISPFVPDQGEKDLRGVEWYILNNPPLKIQNEIKFSDKHLNTVVKHPHQDIIATAGADSNIYLLDSTTLKINLTIPTSQIEIYGLAFSPDGQVIASAGHNGTIKLWTVDSGALAQTLTAYPIIDNKNNRVMSVQFTPDGNSLISSANDKILKLWNLETGELTGEFKGHENKAEVFDISNDGKLLVTGSHDHTARIWTIQDQKEINVLHIPKRHKYTRHILAVDFSNDNFTVAIGVKDHSVYRWDINTDELKLSGEHHDPIETVFFSEDNQQIIAGDRSGTIKTWSVNRQFDKWKSITPTPRHSMQIHEKRVSDGIPFNDSQTVYSVSRDAFLRQTELSTTNAVQELSQYDDVLISAYSLEDNILAIWHDDKLCLFQEKRGKFLLLWDANAPDCSNIRIPSIKNCVITGNKRGEITFWNYESNESYKTLNVGEGDRISDLQISSDGKYLAYNIGRKKIRILDLTRENSEPAEVHLPGNEDRIGRLIRFRPDSNQFAFDALNSVILWDCETNQQIHELTGQKDGINEIIFSRDSKKMYVTDNHRSIYLWNVEQGTPFEIPWIHTADVEELLLSPDERTLVGSDTNGEITFWSVTNGEPLHSITHSRCDDLYWTSTGNLLTNKRELTKTDSEIDLEIIDFGKEWQKHFQTIRK